MGSPALDTTVFSRVLYQLSYLAAGAKCSRGPAPVFGGRASRQVLRKLGWVGVLA